MAPVLKVLTIGLNGLFLENRIIKYTIQCSRFWGDKNHQMKFRK